MKHESANEKEFFKSHLSILSELLLDRTTKKNIIWATDSYKRWGYHFSDSIVPYNISKSSIIKSRSNKTKEEKSKRSKLNAEVFTPSWMCNKQNNLIDESWFNKKNVFNVENENGWIANDCKIGFPSDKSWMDYVKDIRLEVSCGEAPYLVSRYDSVDGSPIEIENRIGILDRKLRIVNENCNSHEQWVACSLEALKSIYGFEYQGDNLILARINVLFTFIDFYKQRFNVEPDEELLKEVSIIISWNLWQMDGIKCVIPKSCHVKTISQTNLFGEEEIIEYGCSGCTKGTVHNHNGVYSVIMDWEKNKKIKFVDMLGGMR